LFKNPGDDVASHHKS